ncbi:MAG: CBS domain-containing protein, partial [Gammaproteobacteria bacterium]
SKTHRVSSYMSASLVTLHPDMDIMEAFQELDKQRVPGAPVIDDLGNLVGLLAERDCLEAIVKACYHGDWGGRVSEYMQTDITTIEADTSLADAAKLFIETSLRGFPVMDNNRVVGQLNRSDLLKAIIKLRKDCKQ